MGTAHAGNYSATSNEVGTPAVDGCLLHLVQRRGDWAGPQLVQFPTASEVTTYGGIIYVQKVAL